LTRKRKIQEAAAYGGTSAQEDLLWAYEISPVLGDGQRDDEVMESTARGYDMIGQLS
jgi:hypothetical protein